MDRLRALEVFVTVVSQESFTRAANALDTSPANVTRYVNELEAHLGTRLLNRSPRKLSLTESGAAFYDRGRSILNEMAEAEAIASNSSNPRGRLRINASVTFGVRFLAPLWPTFMDKYPEIDLDVVLNDETVDLVKGGYDMAVRISRAGSEDYVARKLMTSQERRMRLARLSAPKRGTQGAGRSQQAFMHWIQLCADGRRVAIYR